MDSRGEGVSWLIYFSCYCCSCFLLQGLCVNAKKYSRHYVWSSALHVSCRKACRFWDKRQTCREFPGTAVYVDYVYSCIGTRFRGLLYTYTTRSDSAAARTRNTKSILHQTHITGIRVALDALRSWVNSERRQLRAINRPHKGSSDNGHRQDGWRAGKCDPVTAASSALAPGILC